MHKLKTNLFVFAAVTIFIASFISIDASAQKESGSIPDVPILLYHSVSDTPIGFKELSVSVKDFDAQMKYLADNGYTPIGFDQLDDCSQFKKPIIITFDDGYSDNYYNAYPILKKYNIKATLFMISGKIGIDPYLSADQIRSMQDIFSFQSHTVNHKRLDKLSAIEARYEFEKSQKDLSAVTNKPVYVLSYPNGKFTGQESRIASEYYKYAVSTMPGKNNDQTNKYMLRRIIVSRSDSIERIASLIK